MPLPDGFVATWQQKAQTLTMFGLPVHEMTREEAVAALAFACDEIERVRHQAKADLDFMRMARARA